MLEGSTCVSLGKQVLALGGGRKAITDGIKSANLHWDGGVAPASAIIDLGGFFTVDRVNVVTYYGDERYYHFRVLTSTGADGYKLFGEKTDDEIATADGTDLVSEPVVARYVKVEMLYNSANPSVHIAECSIYGVPALDFVAPVSEVAADPDDVAYRKPVRAGSNQAFASLVTDGSPDSYWIGENVPKCVDIDLLDNYCLDRVVVETPDLFRFSFNVYGSTDGVRFTRLFNELSTLPVEAKGANRAAEYRFTAPNEVRVLRVMITGSTAGASQSALLSGVRAYGKKLDTPVIPTRKTIAISNYRDWLLENEGIDINTLRDEKGNYRPEQTYTAADTVAALRGLVSRIIGDEYVDSFVFAVTPGKEDRYEITAEGGKVKISGNCGVSIAAGLGHYLKYTCRAHVSQQTKQVSHLPAVLPLPEAPISGSCGLPVRYAYNYCTLSYTMPFFGYEDWQRELDFLLLSGVNLILDTTATEAMWVSYLQKLGYTADEAKDYVCGYCYKAWWLMGNLEGNCGPVSDSWVLDTLEMARRNQRYMTVMGAMPALQTFVGAMPESFGQLAKAHLLEKGYDDVSTYMAPQGMWAGGFVRPNVLKTSYNGYSYLAKLFYDTQKEIYGENTDYYCGDVCHEGGIVPADLSKPEMSAQILSDLMHANPAAVWILQGWWSNPMKEVLDGFGELRKNHIMILDLAALASPKWTDPKTWDGVEFGGTGWIYCILDNYGGRTGLHGKLRKMAALMADAKAKATMMKGIGITPEGSYENPVVFDLFWEMAWHEGEMDVDEWVKEYALRRYGSDDPSLLSAWEKFEKTVYGVESYDGTTKNNVINENASLAEGYCVGGYYKAGYDRDLYEEGVDALMLASALLGKEQTYDYDVVDHLRHTLTLACDDYFEVLKRAFAAGDYEAFHATKSKYLAAMGTVAKLSSYNKDEMLGNWIGRGHDFASDPRSVGGYDDCDFDLMEYNARIILTVWASAPITNYANRQYDGLMEDYFIRMWRELLEKADAALEKGEKIAPSLGGKRCYEIGWDFALNGKHYPRVPGDPTDLARIYREDVRPHMHNRAALQSICKALDAVITEHTEAAEVSSTIATNIEH